MSNESSVVTKKSRGRPKQFDRGSALDKALNLFWRHGYEATSLTDLVEATGAKAPTLYAEFGNKEGLFRATVEHYFATFAERSLRSLHQDNLTIEQAVEAYLRNAVAIFTDDSTPTGCFVVCASAALSSMSEDIAKLLRSHNHSQENTLREYFEYKKQQGELITQTPSTLLAKYLNCTVQGMSVQARDDVSRGELDQLVDTVLQLWPQLLQMEKLQIEKRLP